MKNTILWTLMLGCFLATAAGYAGPDQGGPSVPGGAHPAVPAPVLNPVKHYGVTVVGANAPVTFLNSVANSITWARFTVITKEDGATSPGLGAGFGAGGASGAMGDALTGAAGGGNGGLPVGFNFTGPAPRVSTTVVPIPAPTVNLDNFNQVVVLPATTNLQVDVPPGQPGGGATTVVVNVPPPRQPTPFPLPPAPGGSGTGSC
jgi:hypothetical protein